MTASPSKKSAVVWTHYLFYKRSIRDYIRYKDKLVCAATHIVKTVLERATWNGNGNAAPNNGEFDAFRIPRGYF
jgi:hypothetical protein